jgi:hypothetical protein
MDVQLVLLRALAGMGARTQETPLKAGMVLPARVLGGGAILLAGVKLAAQLPPGLEPGSVVRLKVEEASNERLMLKVVETVTQPGETQAPAAAAQPVPTFAVPLPNGAAARLLINPEDDAAEASGGVSGERSFVTLRYESAGLGRVDLALSVEPGVVRAVAHAPAGEVAERLRAGSGELRAMLSNALGRPASVDIVAHAETFDAAA